MKALTTKTYVLILPLLLSPYSVMAQGTGHLKGRISDQAGAAIEKTQVAVESSTSTFEISANENGDYDLELPAGTYKISTKKIAGFVPFKRDRIRVEAGKTTTLNIELKVTSKDAICILYITASPTKKATKSQKGRSKN
jgi:hypothetical protein